MKNGIDRMPILPKTLAPAALALLLGGCISFGGGGKPPPTLFSLTPTRSAAVGATAGGRAEDAIVVLDPETDRRLAVQRIPVQVDASNVAYLQNAQWIERPSRLFRGLLAETIRAKGTRLVFEDTDATAAGRTRLAGRLLDMGYDGQAHAVIVRYDAIKESPGGTVETRRFEARIPDVAAKADAVGPALNSAANDVAGQVADWIG